MSGLPAGLLSPQGAGHHPRMGRGPGISISNRCSKKFHLLMLWLLDHTLRTTGLTDTSIFLLPRGSLPVRRILLSSWQRCNNIPFVVSFFVCFLIFWKYHRMVPKEVFISSFLWNTARRITFHSLQLYIEIQIDLIVCMLCLRVALFIILGIRLSLWSHYHHSVNTEWFLFASKIDRANKWALS